MTTNTDAHRTTKWTRTQDGYRSEDGRLEVTDNGPGMGPAKGSGRWAVVVDGKWIANVDRLDEAKRRAEETI